MNRIMISGIIFLFFLITFNLSAQEIPVPYKPNFTSAISSFVQFDFDVTDSIFIDPNITHELIYRDLPATTWNTENMSLLYEACSVFTVSTQLVYTPPSGMMEYIYRSENDTAVASQSPKNAADLFPVPSYLMADMGSDPAGDQENTTRTYLDIRHAYASYSDDRLYFQLDNNGGGFPTSSGLFTYFIYSVGIYNPDIEDSLAYVLLYANVPALFDPGLYRLDATDSSFTRIADITYNISGNSLSLSCAISDLVAQPEWEIWPPSSGLIGMAPVTATAEFTNLQTNDFGKYGIYAPHSNTLDYNTSNNPPSLDDASVIFVEPDTFSAEIIYTDPDNHLPVLRDIYIESVAYPMTACDKDYQAGTLFEQKFQVTMTGWYRYYFEFSDGLETVTTETDSLYIDLNPYICGDANSDEIVDVSDAVFLINFVFVAGSPEPDPMEAANVNCDVLVDISDAVYLINFVFDAGSPAPCDCK